MTGRLLGRFRVQERVGQGGMGVVYRATDTRLNREVALKLIHPSLVQDPDARRRFLREAQAASSISHPNVCTIHSIEEEDDQIFLVLEYLEGATLQQQVREKQIDLKELLDWWIQGAEGLAEAHLHGVVHRDIKPGNLWVTLRGLVKLMDFGLAKQVQRAAAASADTEDFTDAGITVGTTQYMSPEQARGREVEPPSDVFSFGVVLYETATLQAPFTGASTVDVLDNVLNHDPAAPSTLKPDLPVEFDRIVQKCLRKDAAERYPSAADLVVDLKGLRRDLLSGVRTPSSGQMSGQIPAHRRSTARLVLLILGAVIAVVGLTVGTVLLTAARKAGQQIPPARPAVAVLPFENRTGDERLNWYGANAPDLLVSEMAKLANLDVISKQRIYDVLRDLRGKTPEPSVLDSSVATEVAAKSGATILVRGDTLLLSGSVILKADLVELHSGRLLGSARVTGVNEQNMLDKVDELGRMLAERLRTVK